MPRNIVDVLASEVPHRKVARSKNVQQLVEPATAPSLEEFSQELINNPQLSKPVQQKIKLLIEQNVSLQRELLELAQKESQARYLAYHDGLTGLPNRSLLQDRFRQVMSQAERHHKPLALLMVDLDEFKHVNDKLGHASGDKLLQAVALRLSKGIRGADTVCRYGGDEFVILLPDIESPKIAAALAVEICGRLSEPYLIDGHKIHMAVSLGIAVYPSDGQTFDDLIKQADIAMYRSKATAHSTSITEQSIVEPFQELVGPPEFHNLPASQKNERMRARNLFIQDELTRGEAQPLKYQQI